MHDPYASLTQRREPLTPEDQKAVRAGARAAGCLGRGILIVTSLGAVGALVAGSALFAAGFAVFVVAAFFILRGAKADAVATEKIVYAGTVTDKRALESTSMTSTGPTAPHAVTTTSTSYVVAVDGVDFRVTRAQFELAERGHRLELHCLHPGMPFHVVRA